MAEIWDRPLPILMRNTGYSLIIIPDKNRHYRPSLLSSLSVLRHAMPPIVGSLLSSLSPRSLSLRPLSVAPSLSFGLRYPCKYGGAYPARGVLS